jgi:lysophospholipase L1-like esterase
VRRLLRALTALSTLPLAVLPATVSHAAAPPATYLALGDSVAAGVGASRPELGYVPLVAGALTSESINLSVAGATTTTLIATQLPAATSLLQQRNSNATPEDDVRLITLTVGGNDLFQPVIAACQNPTAPLCSTTVATQLQQVATNYAVILGRLRAAAGRDTTIAVTTYYNGLAAPSCPAAALRELAQVVLEGGPGVSAGLNDIIRQTAQAHGAVVVETAPVVAPAEIRPDCLHPTDQGHADIAGAVTAAVLSTVGGPGRPTPTPAPVQPGIVVSTAVIDHGDTHLLGVFGRVGARVDLFGNGRLIRSATLAEGDRAGGGAYVWEMRPGHRTLFHAVVDGVRTETITVRVRRTVTIGVSQASGIYTFTGAISRPEAGVQVTVARLDAVTKRVTGVASTSTTAGGRYAIRTGLPIGQAGYYALTAAESGLDAGRSRLYGLIVPRPAPRPVVQQTVSAPRPIQPVVMPRQPVVTPAAYANCRAARQAGAAPVFRGEPGYGRHLDRDNDGIGCE